MTQKFNQHLYLPAQNVPPPPRHVDVPQSMIPLPPGEDFIQEQYGGGRRHESPPVELTPTRLRSTIKATRRDIGIVREAAIRRQGTQLPPDAHADASAPPEAASLNPSHDDSVAGGGASPPSLPSSKSRHTSPYSNHASSPRPTVLHDMFYAPMVPQHEWAVQNSLNFDMNPMMDDRSFTAMLMDTEDPFLTSPSYANQQNTMEGSSSQRPHQEAVLTSLTTNIIPPTPLQDTGGNSTGSVTNPTPFQNFKLDAPSEGVDGGQDNADMMPSGEPSGFVPGRKSANTNAILEAGFVDIEHSFVQLSKSTSMPLQQVISCFLKGHGRTTVSINFWNLYARSYFKDNVEQELARVGVTLPADGGSPNMSIRTKCYELFKKAFPDTFKEILLVQDEVKTLSGSPQTVSQRAHEFQKYYKRLFAT
ncbi:hypothetical protein M405DRAFT_848307, partial [Rhizopogon salebrosus TDB-379]